MTELIKVLKRCIKQNDLNSKSYDGMYSTLCVFGIKNDNLEYAFAKSVLYKISNGTLTEYTPTKAAIGGFTSEKFDYKAIPLIRFLPISFIYLRVVVLISFVVLVGKNG